MSATSEHLLANRELLNLDRAELYLGSRARVRTPLGAVEYLSLRSQKSEVRSQKDLSDLWSLPSDLSPKDPYEERLRIAIDCMEIYRNAFPREYAASTSAPFAIQREHELYHLIHTQLFPLVRTDDGRPLTVEELRRRFEIEPDYFLPYIPMRGTQAHLWQQGLFNFAEIEIEYRLALALAWQWQARPGEAWAFLQAAYGLDDCPEPMRAVEHLSAGVVGWSLFCYSCQIEDPPLQWLPLAFQAVSYKTGNSWLDLPQVGFLGFDWSLAQVCKLHLMYSQAEDMKLALRALGAWLEENPRERVARCVEIWNDAVRKELQSGIAGALRDDETGAWM